MWGSEWSEEEGDTSSFNRDHFRVKTMNGQRMTARLHEDPDLYCGIDETSLPKLIRVFPRQPDPKDDKGRTGIGRDRYEQGIEEATIFNLGKLKIIDVKRHRIECRAGSEILSGNDRQETEDENAHEGGGEADSCTSIGIDQSKMSSVASSKHLFETF